LLEKVRLRLEFASNIAILVAAGVVCVVAFRDHRAVAAPVVSANTPTPKSHSIQSPLKVQGIQWSTSERTLVFVLSSQCRFCRESSPFYRRLIALKKPPQRLQFLAFLPPGDLDGPGYLKTAGLTFQHVREAEPRVLGVRGTPTLILVDRNGNVLRSWSGKLPPQEENNVLDALD
jgi:hypothetical protein